MRTTPCSEVFRNFAYWRKRLLAETVGVHSWVTVTLFSIILWNYPLLKIVLTNILVLLLFTLIIKCGYVTRSSNSDIPENSGKRNSCSSFNCCVGEGDSDLKSCQKMFKPYFIYIYFCFVFLHDRFLHHMQMIFKYLPFRIIWTTFC